MRLRVPSGTVLLVLLEAALGGSALAQPIPIWAGAPITHMNEKDVQLFREAMGQALADSKDGSEFQWENPETQAKGSVKAVRTFDEGDRRCRDVYLDSYAKGRREKGTYPFCRKKDGGWEFAPGAGVKKSQ